MNRHRVLLFAQLAERIGAREIEIELPPDATVAVALETLGARHACVRELEDRLAVAIDERYAGADEAIPTGSTLALIPPVSGG